MALLNCQQHWAVNFVVIHIDIHVKRVGFELYIYVYIYIYIYIYIYSEFAWLSGGPLQCKNPGYATGLFQLKPAPVIIAALTDSFSA